MDRSESTNKRDCPLSDISAYLDGELSPSAEMDLTAHLVTCTACRDELNFQKQFLNALEGSLEAENQIQLPRNFTRTVVATAENSVAGLRRPNERRNALIICGTLLLLSLLALGGNAQAAFSMATAVLEKTYVLAASATHLAYDLAFGSTVVFRSLATTFVFESVTAITVLLVLFVLSLYLFSRLLIHFDRT